MSWILCPVFLLLAFHLIVFCRAEKHCKADMWSLPRTVVLGDYFIVYCRCKCPEVQQRDMYIQASHLEYKWETNPIDTDTVSHIEIVMCGREYFRIYCKHGNETLGELYVKVIPLINLREFGCSKLDKENKAMCNFIEVGFAASIKKKNYSLSVDGLPSVPCVKVRHYYYECRDLYIPNNLSNHLLELAMEYEGFRETRLYPMNMREAPVWPMTQPQFIEISSNVCLNWTLTDDNPWLQQILRAEIRPQNPKIKVPVEELFIFPKETSIICLPKLPYANQLYSFRFSRRYNVTDYPWSPVFQSKKIKSMAAIPARPPMVLTNGFYHDSKKNELYVFWRQLDELELNGPKFTYAAITDVGKNPSSIDSNSALFSHWDTTLPAVIYVWSQNSVGNSTITTRLEVPLLTNSESLQVMGLRYHDDNFTLRWQAPRDRQGLIGYNISWCLGSARRYQICDEQDPIQVEVVEGSQIQFQFNQSMLLSNMAVAASYKDKPSGGMSWIGPRFPSVRKEESKTTGLSLIQVIAVIILMVALLSLSFVSFRKLRNMANIKVTLPDILSKSVDIEIPFPVSPVSIAVPGNFSPNGVFTTDILTKETSVDEDAEGLPNLDYSSKPVTPDTVSASSSRKDLAIETQPETEQRLGPHVTAESGYVMSPA